MRLVNLIVLPVFVTQTSRSIDMRHRQGWLWPSSLRNRQTRKGVKVLIYNTNAIMKNARSFTDFE